MARARTPSDTPRSSRTPDQAVELLAAMRGEVEAAAGDIERLTSELTERTRAVDELEVLVDALLGVVRNAVFVIGDDRRIRAASQGAEAMAGGGDIVGKPLSSVLRAPVVDAVVAALDGADATGADATGDGSGGDGGDGDGGDGTLAVRRLSAGALVIVGG